LLTIAYLSFILLYVMPLAPDAALRRKDAAYWRDVYENAAKRLAELRAERDTGEAQLEELSREILRFEQVLTSLQPITSDGNVQFKAGIRVEGIAEMGLADACREILKQGTSYRTARGIRDSLAASGYALEQHTNPLASIHGVLKRLAESGDVEQLESEGKTRYRWKGQTRLVADTGKFKVEGLPPKTRIGPPTREEAIEMQKELQSKRKREFERLAIESLKKKGA
jgi:hypothetical protein